MFREASLARVEYAELQQTELIKLIQASRFGIYFQQKVFNGEILVLLNEFLQSKINIEECVEKCASLRVTISKIDGHRKTETIRQILESQNNVNPYEYLKNFCTKIEKLKEKPSVS